MFFKKKKRKIINVDGMTCDHCVKKIESVLEPLADVLKVKVDLGRKSVLVLYENTLDEVLLQNKIEELGYIVTGIKDES